MSNKSYKFLDLSGYMFSGKHALNLLIRELEGFAVPEFDIEFNLLRIQDGINDLEKNLVDDWSIIRSNSAITRFKKLIQKLDGTYSRFPHRLFSFHSDYYNTMFNNKFTELSNRYIDELVSAKWSAEWPYPLYDMCDIEAFTRKIKKRFNSTAYENEFHLIDGSNFYTATKHYLNDLLSNFEAVNHTTETIVMNNAFEPFNSARSLRYFDNAKCIIVRRDPRDMYVTGTTHSKLYSKISHGNNVDNFIKRFLMQENNTNITPHKDIMFLQYEDLILDYEMTVNKILTFLEIDKNKHVHKGNYLKPEESKKFIGLYKNHQNQKEIKMIEKALSQYCLIKEF